MAQRINKEATKNDVKGKISITILAALFLPAIGLITYGIYNLIHATSESCVSHETGYGGVYDTCTSNAERFLIPLLIVVPIAVLSYLYARVKMKYAFARAVGVTALLWGATILEAAIGATLILSFSVAGLVLYLVLVVVGIAAAQSIYWKTSRYRKDLKIEQPGKGAESPVDVEHVENTN